MAPWRKVPATVKSADTPIPVELTEPFPPDPSPAAPQASANRYALSQKSERKARTSDTVNVVVVGLPRLPWRRCDSFARPSLITPSHVRLRAAVAGRCHCPLPACQIEPLACQPTPMAQSENAASRRHSPGIDLRSDACKIGQADPVLRRL